MTSALQLARFDPVGMVVIYDQTLAADTASFDVPSIPQGYKHLQIQLTGRASPASAQQNVYVQFNNDSGSNYWSQQVTAAGGTVSASAPGANQSFMHMGFVSGDSGTAGNAGTLSFDIADYASTSFRKTLHSRGEAPLASFYLVECSGIWFSTAAINRIAIYPDSGSWKAGSRLTIYGLGGAPAATVVGTDGWTNDTATWTYASATTFTVAGDQTAKFLAGTRVKLTQTTVKFFVVVGSAHSAGTTTVTIAPSTDYTFANAVVIDPHYSYMANPQGYPTWFNWTPTYTGFSADPSGGFTKFNMVGSMVTVYHRRDNTGTSNATSFTLTLPIKAVVVNHPARVVNNGAAPVDYGYCEAANTNILSVYRLPDGQGWTASGGKGAHLIVQYEVAFP